MVTIVAHQELVRARTKTGAPASLSKTVGSTTPAADPPPPGGDVTTTNTKPPAKRRPVPLARPPAPRAMLQYRARVTAITLLLFAASVLSIAFFKGLGKPITVPTALVGLSVALIVGAQRPWFYRWLEGSSKSTPPLILDDLEPAPAAAPAARPAAELGSDFAYIVGFVRHLAATGQGKIFDEMQSFYEWVEQVEQAGDDHPYVDSAERVWSLAKTMRAYVEVKDKKIAAGTFDPGNPMPFLAELEDHHFVAATVAAYMLVRRNSEIDDHDQLAVMEPWMKLHLPYRVGDVTYLWDKQAGRYAVKRFPATASPRPTTIPGLVDVPGSERPVEDLDTVIALRRADQVSAPPAPAPVAPALAEPVADDVPDWTKEQLAMAAELVIRSQLGSQAMLERKMRIPAALARKIMYQLNLLGVVSDYNGKDNRDVKVPTDELDDVLEFIAAGGQ